MKNLTEYGYSITEYEEKNIVPVLIEIIKEHHGKINAINSKNILQKLSEKGYKLIDVRLRKCVKYIQINVLVKWIVANNDGFFFTEDVKDIQDQISGLKHREEAISHVRIAFETSLL